MRSILSVTALVLVALASPAQAQSGAPHYTAGHTQIGTILADSAAREALGRRFPKLLQSKAVLAGRANRFTLRALKRFKPNLFTDAALAAIDSDFARMPGR